MKIFVLGNPAYEPDSLALVVGKELQDHDVVWLENPFHLLELLEKDPKAIEKAILLDVAYGIDEPKVFQDLDKLRTIRLGSLHDFDIAYFLKLLHTIGKVDHPKILALPIKMGLEEAVVATRKLLE